MYKIMTDTNVFVKILFLLVTKKTFDGWMVVNASNIYLFAASV